MPVQNVDDLRLVSADKAKTVIVMDPDHGSQGQVFDFQLPLVTILPWQAQRTIVRAA